MKLAAASGDQLRDESALDIGALYTEHAPFLGRVIQRLVGAGPHVDDLLQETFIVAFRKRAEFAGRASARTWLYAIAARMCMRHRRGLRRFSRFQGRLAREVEPARALPDEQVEWTQSALMVHEIIGKLPFEQREVFILYEIEGLEGKDIAAMIGRPLGTVWTRLHHARKAFTKLMAKRIRE